MAAVELDHVSVATDGAARLHDVTIAIDDGAIVGIVGSSGSGKTSLLRAVAGLDRIVRGRVLLGGRDVTDLAPGVRDVSMVFQSPALIGHLSARRNVSFPLDIRRIDAEETRLRVDAEVRALHIEELMERQPSTLSVGEQQMVQIARALVRVPNVLLLDEPFAALDDQLRGRMRAELGVLQSGYGVTTLMTSNESTDIEALAEIVAVLDEGRLVQAGETAAVRRLPVNLMAAVATGPLSLIDMTVIADQRGFWLQREDPAGGELVRLRAWASGLARYVGTTVTVGLRPEDVEIGDSGTVPATVDRATRIGVVGTWCTVAGVRVGVTAPDRGRTATGGAVRLRVHHHLVFNRADDRLVR